MLIHALRARLGDAAARSFLLRGDAVTLLSGAALREAAAAYEAELGRTVPAPLHAEFEREQAAWSDASYRLIHRYGRSIHTRIRGYLVLGRALGFEYPWPVVAILGLCEVLDGVARTRVYGLAGRVLRRFGHAGLDELASGLDDVLLRTNRGIFNDSVPITLLALRATALRREGRPDLADALLAGPLGPLFDEQSRRLSATLSLALDEPNGTRRYRALASLVAEQFEREQAIFTDQMGPTLARRPGLLGQLLRTREINAPRVDHSPSHPRLSFHPFPLPEDFDWQDHTTRVEVFTRAYVDSVLATPDDYRAALAYVIKRFGRPGARASVSYPDSRATIGDMP